jgi:hypothetical protein
MTQVPQRRELTEEELAAEGASELPDREAMSLLDLTVDLGLSADIAAPIDAAIAANANVAAPIDAAVSANVLSVNSVSMASADQDAAITQNLDGVATATAPQTSVIEQGETPE